MNMKSNGLVSVWKVDVTNILVTNTQQSMTAFTQQPISFVLCL